LCIAIRDHLHNPLKIEQYAAVIKREQKHNNKENKCTNILTWKTCNAQEKPHDNGSLNILLTPEIILQHTVGQFFFPTLLFLVGWGGDRRGLQHLRWKGITSFPLWGLVTPKVS